ncbi:MAG: hypothetical protein IJL08_08105 [Oscillospiraceae bacterium]|nr:hypothetical protein [Oscillospiraceae bacterium]
MRETKFSMNALVLVVIIFSAITFFVSIRLVDLADRRAVNEFYPVEGTDVAVRYSNLYPNGIYEGDRVNGELKVPGDFGHDWGAAAIGDQLYVNEHTRTDMGMIICQVVRVDLNTFEKEVLWRDTMLRGRCASGELVCLKGFLMPSNFPKTNSLCRLYSESSEDIRPESEGGVVMFVDGESGEILYSVRDDEAQTDVFERRYLERTLEEVRG